MKKADRPCLGRRAALAVVAWAAAGCTTGLGLVQTARTLPPGEFRQTVSAGLDWNFMMDSDRGATPGNLILQYGARYGLRADLDVGLKLFFGLGALADAKWQVIDRARLAVSLLGGAGGAYDAYSGAEVFHAPLMLLVSYRLANTFTPYAGAGYGAFWIFNYGYAENLAPGAVLAPRAWHGDGLLMLHAGFEIGIFRRSTVLLEYGYLRQIVDDPGDRYDFASNHLVLAGLAF
jgi:hypothetical protein